jgi:hypothetical protein
MTSNVVHLHRAPQPIGHYLCVGPSGHRQLETLIASGCLPFDRIVVDAAAVTQQRDLIEAMRNSGCELVLDTNVAELSAIGRYQGFAKRAPWANPNGVLRSDQLISGSNYDAMGQIARFALRHGFHAVQSPTRLLENSAGPSLAIDCANNEALRRALDIEGGSGIAIDYSLITTSSVIKDPVQRRAILSALASLPFENLWLRISGFGSDATGVGPRRHIAAIIDLHDLKRPVIVDCVGGIAALAVVAFGAAGGLAHGVVEKERFDAGGWKKPRQEGGGGRERRILFPGLDRLLSENQTETLMAAAGARRLLSCPDPACCPIGLDDTIRDYKGHYLNQRSRQIRSLSAVPESRRARHFLDHNLVEASRMARRAAQLRVLDVELKKSLAANRDRLDRMQPVLEDLHKTIDGNNRSLAPRQRSAAPTAAPQQRRW